MVTNFNFVSRSQEFTKLDSITRKNIDPIPQMKSILVKLRKAKVISTIDLSQAYYQVEIEENSRKHTAFRVPGRGVLHYTL